MIYKKNRIRIVFFFLFIFTLSNCSALRPPKIIYVDYDVAIHYLEKRPFEIPDIQKIQPTKDFSFAYKLGEFSEEVESITYSDVKGNLGTKNRIGKKNYKNKILEVKENGDYLLSRSWEGNKSDCESSIIEKSWYDKHSNKVGNDELILDCKEHKKNNYKPILFYKLDNLLLDTPIYHEGKNDKITFKIDVTFIGVATHKKRDVGVLLTNKYVKSTFSLFGNDMVSKQKFQELVYIDLKSKLPLLRKLYLVSVLEEVDTMLLLSVFNSKFIEITQSIHTYTYPSGYLE
ncbi:MAG: hypothetical protein KBA66_11550 [Leptospiraceae bacterium]|nr:hypothetical protein [Leptospiraceae bacterium]